MIETISIRMQMRLNQNMNNERQGIKRKIKFVISITY